MHPSFGKFAFILVVLQTFLINAEIIQNHLVLETKHSTHPNSVTTFEQTVTLSGALQYTLKNIGDLIQSLIESLTIKVPEITKSSEALFAKLTARIVVALELFSNQLFNAGDELLREMFIKMQIQVSAIKDEFEYLALKLDEQFDQSVMHLNETLMNNTERIDAWTANIKQELRTVNDTRIYRNGCKVIDEFIVRSTEQLQRCCSITIKPMRSICRSTRYVLAEALNVLADAMDRIQTCLEDKNSYLEYMIPCINAAYDDIAALAARAAQLRQKINTMLPVKILYSRCCISMVLVQIDQRQNKLAASIFSNDNNLNTIF